MGFLGKLKNKAKNVAKTGAQRVVRKVAKATNIPMNESRTERDQQEILKARESGGPSFREKAGTGWTIGHEELTLLGTEGLGMLQARWTDSELSARQKIDHFSKDMTGVAGLSDRIWAQAGEIMLRGWQARGEEVATAWTATFDKMSQVWGEGLVKHGDEAFAEGYRGAAGEFDRTWQKAWEGLQGSLQKAGSQMKASVDDAQGALGNGLPQDLANAFEKAGSYLEETILRAEAELWGVWGTNGARIRGVSRTATEERGDAEAVYREVFTRCRSDFDVGFKSTLSDFESTWTTALHILKEAGGEGQGG